MRLLYLGHIDVVDADLADFLALSLLLLALFALQSWGAFTTPTELTLGPVGVQAPLGLVMLVVTAVFCGMFMLYILVQQAGLIADSRRYAKELKSQRELADKAEASRFTELQNFLTGELRQLRERSAEETAQTGQRIAQLEQRLSEKLDETTRVLSSYVGEVEDKLDRSLGSRPA